VHQKSLGTDLEITGNLNAVQMCLLRDDYIAVLCQVVDDDTTDETIVVIHIPSRKEVCRTQLLSHDHDDMYPSCCSPRLTQDCQETVGLSLSWEGVVMTGRDVRDIIASSANTTSFMKPKKKPHLRNNQGYKKDGFRLGKK
jgi:hypothetical protein